MNKFIFFGTSDFSVTVLDQLKTAGFLPTLVVSTEDKPKGRKLILTPTDTKVWAEKNNIPCIQPKSLRNPEAEKEIMSHSPAEGYDFAVVASYGKILPDNILNLPKHKTLNVHPSLLPKLRGASPVQSSILTEDETGVTIIRLDSQMDHGPIIAQEKILSWKDGEVPYADELKKKLGEVGGKMLADLLPDWLAGKIKEVEQDHSSATFCKKIEKEDAELDLKDLPEKNLRKIRAYRQWPTAYFFMEKNAGEQHQKIRLKVTEAHLENGELSIDKVIPEGKKEMNFADFSRTYLKSSSGK